MPSGTHLTLEDRDRILRLAGQRDSDGRWKLSYAKIGVLLRLHPETISAVIRDAADKWGKEHRWKAEL